MSVAFDWQHGGPARQGADAREQLLEGERLHQVVVRPGLEPLDAVGHRVARGEHEDRRGHGPAAQQPAQLEPVHAAPEHDVEDDDVEVAVGRRRAPPPRRPPDHSARMPVSSRPRRTASPTSASSSTTSTRIARVLRLAGYAPAAAVSGRRASTAAPRPVRLNGLVITWLAPGSRAAARSALSLRAVKTMIGRRLRPGHAADPPAEADPVDAGHHHVEDDQVGQAEARAPPSPPRRCRGDHVELLDLEVEADDVHQAGVVVHEQDAGSAGTGRSHRPILGRAHRARTSAGSGIACSCCRSLTGCEPRRGGCRASAPGRRSRDRAS